MTFSISGGIFKLYLKFSESYNLSPPEVFFITIPYHPNVHSSTGKACVDFLDNIDDWKESYNIVYILLSIQALLVNPVLENAINEEAASKYRDNIKVYRETVLNCVLTSKRLDANLPGISIEGNTRPISVFNEEDQKPSRNLLCSNKLSFEDYLKLWKGIATSNPSKSPLSALSDYLKTDQELQKAHFELSRAEVEQEIRVQLAEHRKLMYGTFGGKDEKYADSVGIPTSPPTRGRMLRHVYVGKPNTAEPTTPESTTQKDDLDDLDKEALDLVNWSRNLSTEQTDYEETN